jgi:uncharacterized protein
LLRHAPTAPRTFGRGALLVALVLARAWAAAADPSLPPRPAKYATDRAQSIAPARLSALNERLAAFERETSNQVLVYVDRRVPAGTTLEEMSTAAMRAWGVGQKGTRNGVLLFVFVDDRKMRIEVGYGLEGALPDASAHRITDGVIKPHFRRGDYAAGVEAGVDAILKAVRAEGHRGTGVTAAEKARGVRKPNPPAGALTPEDFQPRRAVPERAQPRPDPHRVVPATARAADPIPSGLLWAFVVIAFPLAGLLLRSAGLGIVFGALVGALACFVAAVVNADITWLIVALVLGALSLLAFLVRMGMVGGPAAAAGTTSWTTDSSSSWDTGPSWDSGSSSSSDSGSSSSDFSGGGGDSGGGGSSDSW